MDFYDNHKDLSLFYEIIEVLEQVQNDIEFVLSDEFCKYCDESKQTCANQIDLIGNHLAEISKNINNISDNWFAQNKKDTVILSKELLFVSAAIDEINAYLKIHSVKFKYKMPSDEIKAVKNDIVAMRDKLKARLSLKAKDREKLEKLMANILRMSEKEIQAFSEDEIEQLIENINYWAGYAICMTDNPAPQNFIEKEHIVS